MVTNKIYVLTRRRITEHCLTIARIAMVYSGEPEANCGLREYLGTWMVVDGGGGDMDARCTKCI